MDDDFRVVSCKGVLRGCKVGLAKEAAAMLHCWALVLVQIVLRANHRAGQVAFQGAVGQICLLDAAISTSSSRGKAILRHCIADKPARCFAREKCYSISLISSYARPQRRAICLVELLYFLFNALANFILLVVSRFRKPLYPKSSEQRASL